METKSEDLFITKGDTKTWELTLTNGAGTAFNITGWTIYFTAKQNIADASPKISKTITSHSDPTHGKTRITLSTTDTNQTAGKYYYDIQVKNLEDAIYTVQKGQLFIEYEVTTPVAP